MEGFIWDLRQAGTSSSIRKKRGIEGGDGQDEVFLFEGRGNQSGANRMSMCTVCALLPSSQKLN